MKNYLSFGGGVNSVAMYLHLLDEGVKFEAVFVDHGTDWPETYEYVKKFSEKRHLTIIKPKVQGYDNLYNYYFDKKTFPFMRSRDCSQKFKSKTLESYYRGPAFIMIGFDYGEAHRARIKSSKKFEYRYPLIEAEIGRYECKKIIERHGLSIPPKSGCFICPFQKAGSWIELRIKHPELFCKAEQMEKQCNERRALEHKKPVFINNRMSVKNIVQEDQVPLFKEDEYPPCECML